MTVAMLLQSTLAAAAQTMRADWSLSPLTLTLVRYTCCYSLPLPPSPSSLLCLRFRSQQPGAQRH
jgi:hypothetical protein